MQYERGLRVIIHTANLIYSGELGSDQAGLGPIHPRRGLCYLGHDPKLTLQTEESICERPGHAASLIQRQGSAAPLPAPPTCPPACAQTATTRPRPCGGRTSRPRTSSRQRRCGRAAAGPAQASGWAYSGRDPWSWVWGVGWWPCGALTWRSNARNVGPPPLSWKAEHSCPSDSPWRTENLAENRLKTPQTPLKSPREPLAHRSRSLRTTWCPTCAPSPSYPP